MLGKTIQNGVLMRKKRLVLSLSVILFIALLSQFVAANEIGDLFSGLFETVFSVLGSIFEVIKGDLSLTMRICIGVIAGAAIYGIGGTIDFIKESDTLRWSISIIIPVITAVFIPDPMVLFFGFSWATLIILSLFMATVVLFVWFIYKIVPGSSRTMILAKIGLLLLAIFFVWMFEDQFKETLENWDDQSGNYNQRPRGIPINVVYYGGSLIGLSSLGQIT